MTSEQCIYMMACNDMTSLGGSGKVRASAPWTAQCSSWVILCFAGQTFIVGYRGMKAV